jgi:hypothetical protein
MDGRSHRLSSSVAASVRAALMHPGRPAAGLSQCGFGWTFGPSRSGPAGAFGDLDRPGLSRGPGSDASDHFPWCNGPVHGSVNVAVNLGGAALGP